MSKAEHRKKRYEEKKQKQKQQGKHLLPNAVAHHDEGAINSPLKFIEAKHLGLSQESEESAYVALKYYQNEHQCFSDWPKDQLKAFSEFVRKLQQQTWTQIYRSGSTQDKVGLGYTAHKNREKLPSCQALDYLSEDITFFELRVTQKARVHGFRVKSTFFLVWLDVNHQIYSE